MFYSHEVLTSRKYGVATVWLVATIGSKSNLKKVNRKAILEVDVKKACDTIIFPEAPMALRLQSNLLYGVSRVYSQQCGYVLTDAQKAQEAMRNLFKVSKSNELDPDAGNVRPEQLMLMDDPAFMGDLALPPLDFDILDPDFGQGESQNSLLSPGPRRRASSSASRASSVLDIRLSNSSASGGRGTYQLPDLHDDPFAPMGSSARKGAGTNLMGRIDDEELGLEEVDWEFDDEGNEVPVQGSGAAASFREKLLSGAAASGAVRREHEEGQAARGADIPAHDEDGDFYMMGGLGDDDFGNQNLDPNAEAFPVAAASRENSRDKTAEQQDSEASSDEMRAPQKKARQARRKKTILADMTLVITNKERKDMSDNYLEIMRREAKAKQARQLNAIAKSNAKMWISGNGIGGVGRGIGKDKIPSPLEMFSGEALLAAILGKHIPAQSPHKRASSPPPHDGSDAEGRRVRPRLGEDEDEDLDMDAMARGDDDDLQPMFDDEGMDVELGREGHSALDDHMSSQMPWNMSGGARGRSSSVHGPGTGGRAYMSGSLRHSSIRGENPYQFGSQIGRGREGSRLTSASPLGGRGIMALEHGSDDTVMGSGQKQYQPGPSTQEREFEIFGPSAAVDTQTAAQSQWVRKALDHESENFLDFVKTHVAAKESQMGKGKAVAIGDEDEVGFEDLIPRDQSVMVAAHAFLHVLTLATKGYVGVRQEEEEDGFGEVKIWVTERGEVAGRVIIPEDDEDEGMGVEIGGEDERMDVDVRDEDHGMGDIGTPDDEDELAV